MEITFYTKHVYGKQVAYPADQEFAKAFYSLSGQKTFTIQTSNGLKMLGYTFKEVLAPNPKSL